MVTAVSTSPTSNATGSFNGRHVDRCQDGTLWAKTFGGSGGNVELAMLYSKDNGATWTRSGAVQNGVSGAVSSFNGGGSLFIDLDDYAHVVWKQGSSTNGLTGNYVYYVRGTPNAGRTAWTWSTAVTVFNQAAYDYPDVVAFRDPANAGAWQAAVVGSFTDGSTTNRAVYKRYAISSAGVIGTAAADGLSTPDSGAGVLGGTYSNGAHTYPSIDFNHTGDGKTVAGGTPHLYVGWTAGATGTGKGVRFRKAVYSGGAWTWNTEREIDPNAAVNATGFWQTCHFDGTRVCIPGHWNGAANDSVAIYERDAADTTTTDRLLSGRTSLVPDADKLRHGSATFDAAGNIFFFGRDNTGANGTRKVNRRRWARSTATLDGLVTIDTTGPDAPYLSARRGYAASTGQSIDAVYTDGTASPYTVQFDRLALNVAPNAPTLVSPVGNAAVDRAITQRFSWTFSDPDAGDSQSKADLRYRVVGAGTWTDILNAATTSQFYDFAPSTFAAGAYEWQVRTYDAAGVVGPYSASDYFTAANAPTAPTITDPTNGGTIAASSYTVLWSASAQEAYQVRTVADNAGTADPATVYTDTLTVVDSAARSRTVAFATNNRMEHLQVRVRVSGLWSSWADARVLVSFTPPATPTLVATPSNATASIAVAVTNPTPSGGQPTVTTVDLYRREALVGGAGIRIARAVGGTYTDRTPASSVAYEYMVVATAANGTTASSAWTA